MMLSLIIPFDLSIIAGLKRYIAFFAASLLINLPSSLYGQNSPVITDIVGESILEGGSFAAINLDKVVSDPDNTPDQLTWSYENNVALLVSIQDHVAMVSTPNPDWNGSETITFRVTDPDLNTASDDAVFNVIPVNDAPVIGKIPDQSILQGGSFDLVYLDNYVTDVDNSLADLSWSVSGTSNLSATIDGSHTATVNPAAGWTGKDNLTFVVTDPGGLQDTDNPAYTVTRIETAPVAVDDIYVVAEGGTLSTPAPGVLSNDSDADGDLLSALLVSNPAHSSSFSLNADGSLLYVHDGSETTSDAFRYTPSDGVLTGNEATVRINITPVNDAPVVSDIPDQTVAEDQPFAAISLDNYVTDPDTPLADIVWSASGNSQLSVVINSGTHIATTTAPANWNSSETITFTATDPLNGTGSDPVTFTATPVNDPPVVSGIPDQNINEGASFSTITLDNYVADVDNAKTDITWGYNGNVNLGVVISPSRIATITTPNSHYNGTETITFTATDPMSGFGSDAAVFAVAPLNDPPVLNDISGSSINYTENALPVQLSNSVTVSDIDNTTLVSATIKITAGLQSAEDVLSFTPVSGISGGYDAPSGTLSLSGVAALADYETVLHSVKYNNSSDNPSNLNRTISITVNDGTDPSNTILKTVTVTPVNDPPVVSNIGNQTIAEGSSFGTIILDNFVTDPDNTDNQLTWSYSGNTDLTVSIVSRVATISPPTPDWNGTETITFTATDPLLGSGNDPATFTVTPVNDAPVLDNIENSTLTYTEGSPAVAITNSMTATDIDNANLASALISISSNYASDQDQLTFVNANNISGIWNPIDGTMTLSGSSSVANYQSALRSVKYINNSSNPNTALRTIAFTANDGVASSFPETRNISINTTNNPPVLADPSSTSLNYTENGSPLQLTGTITVADDDNTQLTGATITISPGYQIGQDTLIFTPSGGISGSYDRNNGILTLSGTSLVANYQTALRSVRYANNSHNPVTSARTITFTVNDGTDNSNGIIKTLTVTAVNDAPVLSETSSTPVNYTENASPVQLTGTIAVTDIDNTQLTSATISITSGLHTTEDSLSFTAGNGITGTYSTATGILLLTGTSSLTNYRNALRSVRYKNRSNNPTVTNRIVSFIVNDGSVANPTSNPINKTVTITPVNDPPVAQNVLITASNNYVGTLNTGTYDFVDPDDAEGASTYQWYRSDNSGGILASAITGATEKTYTPAVADLGKFIGFEVLPVDAQALAGIAVKSPFRGPIGVFSAYITGSDTTCRGLDMPITLTISGGVAPFTAVMHRSGSALNGDTTITAIGTPSRIINVKIPGTYTLTSLSDSHIDVADVTSSVPVILVINPKSHAIISGTASICNDGTRAQLHLNFTSGKSPWTVTIRRREVLPYNDTILSNITQSPFTFNARVIGSGPTMHRVVSITDANGCPGDTASGKAWVSFKTSPKAVISGSDSICPGTTATLSVALTGTTPWSITYLRDGINPVTVTNINTSPYLLHVNNTGIYTLSEVKDINNLPGCASGTADIRLHTVPTAVISGTATICEHTAANLNVALTGQGPWQFYYTKNLGDSVLVQNVAASPKTVPVFMAGTYTLYKVSDRNACKGTVSGSAVITVTPAPDVTITGLDPAYKVQTVKVPIYGSPGNGYYNTNPALISIEGVMYFLPFIAGIGTHNIIYNYQDAGTHCVGHDTVTVRVLDAEASIFFPDDRTKFCTNDGPFVITGANIKNKTGTFSINGGVGIHDNGNNTATITPRSLTEGTYTITYTYFDGTYLSISDDFEVGKKPVADFGWSTECFQAGRPISFTNKSVPSFGYFTDSSYFWKIYNNSGFTSDTLANIVYTFPEPGNYLVELQVNNTNGCVDTIKRTFALRPTIKLQGNNESENFESKPITWQSGTLSGSVNSWKLGTPPQAYGYPPDPPDVNIWYTYIPVASAPREQSYVSSPCYDFTGMKMPMVTMNIWRKFNANRDGANIQASADSGKTWNLVGQIGDGVNWFNSYEISGNPGGNTAIGWANIRDADWLEARHSLDMLKDKKQVQFRIYYGSDNTAKNTSGIAFDNFRIGERKRMALIEHFTNTNLITASKADSALNSWAEANKSHVIDIQYHTSNPPGDPFYEANPVIPTTRQFYYGLSSVPYGILDGGTTGDDRFDYSQSNPLNKNGTIIESLGDSYFELQSISGINDNVLNATITMTSIQNLPLTQVSLRIAVIELEIDHTPLGNGDTLFRNVVKTMIPGAAGTSFYQSWTINETSSVDGSWVLQNVNNIKNLRLVAFVQDEATKFVYQALMDTISLVTGTYNPPSGNLNGITYLVYPNPVSRRTTIELNEQSAEDITLEMYNNMGRLVHTGHIPAGNVSAEISVEDYPDGLYLLRLTTSRKLLGISKIIVSK